MQGWPVSLLPSVSWPFSIFFSILNTFSDAVWASFFGLIYRKFFWDFVGGTLRDPGGLQCVYFLTPMLFIYLYCLWIGRHLALLFSWQSSSNSL
jgi:hypothetical protein